MANDLITPNYQVQVAKGKEHAIIEAGICVSYSSYSTILLTGKFRHLHRVIKELKLVTYGEVVRVVKGVV